MPDKTGVMIGCGKRWPERRGASLLACSLAAEDGRGTAGEDACATVARTAKKGGRVPLIVVAVGLVLAGCAEERKSPPRVKYDYSPLSERTSAVQFYAPTLLASGRLPLVYFFENGGHIRIVDTAGTEPLVETEVAPGEPISLSENGLSVGGRHVLAGPLPADHRYEIWWDPKPPTTQGIRSSKR